MMTSSSNNENTFKKYIEEFCNHFDNNDDIEENVEFRDFLYTFKYEKDNHQSQIDSHKSESEINKSFNDLQKLIENNKSILILGEPGAGKTMLLRNFAKNKGKEIQDGINQNGEDYDHILPIFASIRTWNGDEDQEPIYWLIEKGIAVKENINENLLKEKLKNKKVLLILDGLDELPENYLTKKNPIEEGKNYRKNFIEKLNQFQSNYDNSISIIVTCRSDDYKEIENKYSETKLNISHTIKLKLLNWTQIKKYLDNTGTLNEESVKTIIKYLIKNRELGNMVRTPFILNVLRLLYEINRDDQNKIEDLNKIDNSDKLIQKFIENSYNRKKDDNKFPYTIEELEKKLGQAAILMMSDDLSDDNEIYERKDKDKDIFQKIINDESTDEFINYSKNLGLLVPTENKYTKSFRFPHLLLRDYFVFNYVKKFFDENEITTKEHIAIALGKLNRPDVTEFLIKLLKDSDKDVRYEAANSLGQLNAGFYFQGYEKDFDPDWLFSNQRSIPDEVVQKPKPTPTYDSSTVPIEDLIKHVGELKSGHEKLQVRLNEVDKKLEILQSGLSDTNKKIETLQEDDISKLKYENKILQARLNKVEKELQKLQPPLIATSEVSDILQLKPQIEQLQAGLKEVNEKLEKLQSQLSDIDNILPSQQGDISELKSKNEQLQSQLDQANNQLKGLRSKLSDIDKKIITLQSGEIAQEKSENKELQDKLNEISNQLAQLQSQLSNTDKKIEENYQTISQSIEKIYQEMSELEKRISKLPGEKEPKNKRDPWNI